jgi:hypothetical protein
VNVNSSGATEVVVTPDLTEKLLSTEDPAWVLGKIAQQLELFECQVKGASVYLCNVAW